MTFTGASTDLRIADCHNDLLMAVLHQQERGHLDPFGDFWLPQLRSGGVVAQVLPIYTEDQYVGEGALRRALKMVHTAYDIARRHSDDVALVLTGQQLRSVIAQGRIALVLAIEGAEPVGPDLGIFHVLFRAGVRMASLTWNRRTIMADGVGETDTGGKLTSVGLAAIAEMEAIGMIVDVSHLSAAGFWHLMDHVSRPVVASHSSVSSVYDHPRNLTDDQLRAIARAEGVVSLNAFGGFLSDRPTTADFLNHLDYAQGLIGPEHVALGTDFIGDVAEAVDPIFGGLMVDHSALPLVPGLQRPADLSGLGVDMIERFGRPVAQTIAADAL